MLKAKVVEVFKSIQGEGKYVGVSQAFVRFWDCNLRCSWCDTKHSYENNEEDIKEYDVEEMADAIMAFSQEIHSVSLTGGEPLLQKDFIKQLLPILKKKEMAVYLDTNGTLPANLEEVIDKIDIISMDMKLPSSSKGPASWEEHAAFLKCAQQKDVFVKAVISKETLSEDVEKVVELIVSVNPSVELFLQPNTLDLNDGVINKCFDFQNYCLQYLAQVRVIPQLHKFLNIK